jgi:hypothetical protein
MYAINLFGIPIEVAFLGGTAAVCIGIIIYQRLYIRWHWRARNKQPESLHDNIVFTCSFIAIVALISLFVMFV